MLSKKISEKVLTVGCAYDPPKGGVAQVMYTYSKEVYPVFQCVVNSANGGALIKLWLAINGLIKMAWKLALNKNLRIVHIHTASYNSFKRSSWFVRLAKAMGRKVVLHIHGGGFREYYNTNPSWILKILKKADCVLALTDSWRKFYSDDLQLPNVVTVPNIVSNPQIKGVEHDGRFHLLFLGFIVEQKGIFDLIEVIKKHKAEWNGKLLLHVGGSHEVERLQSFIKNNGLENLIQYEGWVSGDKKIMLLNLMDAYILPSYIEGLPISILEALSYGKPVITTPVGGIPEVINEQNGFLFEPGDHNAMYKIINSIVLNPTRLKEKAVNAKNSVDKNFPNSIAGILGAVYNKLLNEE
jgi:glycosyltransferase involved in cell wall biosynthesis